MTKVDIKRLDSVTKNDTTATERINDNFLALQTAIENTLSRDGTGPNYMDADLDMNSYRIINSSDPVEDNDIVNLKYVEERIGGAVEASKTAVSAASQAANSAQSALVSSTNAINTLRNAEEQLNNTITYVDEAKASIDEAITAATDEVKQKALDAANEAINDAAATATGIVVEYANNEIKPLLNEIASNAAESAENASESAGLAANESANAAISATDSQHYAEDSRIWAEGSDSEVNNVDGEHSSKVWSEMAKTSATSAASSAELARQYGNDKINQTHITNCITEIPQDIKLELNDGVLTLKAGSRVYIPNGKNADGSLKFDEVVTESDILLTQGWGSSQTFLLFYDTNGLRLRIYDTGRCYSGTASVSDGAYYNTNDNKLYVYDGGSLNYEASLPIAVITGQSPTITSIDQVFNGFGYIGSTIFALPGVKGLIPNGRNADGSLKNIELTVDSVWLGQALYNTNNASLGLVSNGKIINYVTNADVVYNEIENKNIRVSDGVHWGGCLVGSVAVSDMKFTSVKPKLPFHAVDRNDSSWVSAQAMPSKKRINLTLGASGTTYTAPANGYFVVGIDGVSDNWITFDRGDGHFQVTFVSPRKDTNWVRGLYPIGRGENVNVYYSSKSSSYGNYIDFYYAEGETN